MIAHRSAKRSTHPTTARWAVALDYATRHARGFERAHGRDLDDVFGIVIDQLEPIFGHVGRREDVVLGELGDERKLKIVFADALFLLRGDGAFDRESFGALDDRRDDRAAEQIAPIKNFLAAAPQGDFEEFVFVAMRELPFQNPIDQPIDALRRCCRLPSPARRRRADRS